MIEALHHIQLAMPEGGEDMARAFYSDVLGLTEVPKPPVLAARGGVWFENGAVRFHLGVEMPFRPAAKAHPAFEVSDLAALEARLSERGFTVRPDDDLAGYRRFYVADPFGNRLEFLSVL